MIPDSSPEHTPEDSYTNAQLRAIFWGRQHRLVYPPEMIVSTKRSWSVEGPEDEEAMVTDRDQDEGNKVRRPTTLSDEWRELTRVRDSEGGNFEVLSRTYHQSKCSIWRNFLCLSTSLMLAFMTFLPLRNIQSSLYREHSLGYISLATVYGCFMVGCVFSPWLVQNARPKLLILSALLSHTLYVSAQLSPRPYTLIPASCVFGFLQAPLWSVQELLIGSYGTQYSAVMRIKIERSIQQFQWVFVTFCHSAQILGNLMESVTLGFLLQENSVTCDYRPSNVSIGHFLSHDQNDQEVYFDQHHNDNETMLCDFENANAQQLVEKKPLLYLELAFCGVSVLAVILLASFWSKPDIIVNRRKLTFVQNLKYIFTFFKTPKFPLLGCLMVFTGMQQGILIGDVTMIYGTEGVGLSKVGYLMMCYGTSQLASLLLLEKIKTKRKSIVLVLQGFLLSLGLLLMLYFYEPSEENIYAVLGYMALWGSVDAVWQSQVQSILVSSAARKESAIVSFRICQGLGLTLIFILSIWLSLILRLCITAALLTIGVLCYMALETIVHGTTTPSEPKPFHV